MQYAACLDSLSEGKREFAKDHFITSDGKMYAGNHLIIDVWEARSLDSLGWMEEALRHMIKICGATLLHLHLHHFTPNNGISGVAVLAESHISVHTWPEFGFAAFDAFMCGDAEPKRCIESINQYFQPKRVLLNTHRRGELEHAPLY